MARRSEEQAEREDNEHFKQVRKEREEFLEREHVMKLREADGEKVQPEDFAAPEAPKPKEKKKEEGGGFADLMRFLTGRGPHPRAAEFSLALRIEGDLVVVRGTDEEIATRLLGREPDTAE